MPTKSNNTGGRGGRRPGAGRKKKAVQEKAANGNPGGKPLKVLDIPDMEGVEMPKPHDFLSAEQRDGNQLQAKEIYEETWNWLDHLGCAAMISPQMIERYAVSCARWIQCEEIVNKLGFLSKHPTTQKPAKADPIAVREHRDQLHESGQPALGRDLPDCKRKLQQRLHRAKPAGRPDGKIAALKRIGEHYV